MCITAFAVPAAPLQPDLSSEVPAWRCKTVLLASSFRDAGGLFPRARQQKAWLFFRSTVAFGLLTYMIVGGTRANIIAGVCYSVYRHYSGLDQSFGGCWQRRRAGDCRYVPGWRSNATD